MKMSPKSCGCKACKFGKSTKSGQAILKKTERSFRHQSKIALKKGQEIFSPASYSTYTD